MKKMLLFLLLPLFLFASKEKAYEPWYTGPIIAAGGVNEPVGEFFFQSYLYVKDTYGRYNSAWGHHSAPDALSIRADLSLQTGITHWLDTTAGVHGYYKTKEHQHSTEFGDMYINVGLQLYKPSENSNLPYFRLEIEETFPTGKYEKLNPNKLGIDSTGGGSFDTSFNLIVDKTVYWFIYHPISLRLNIAYSIPSKAHVHGFNSYGGGFGTNGKVSPGQVFSYDLAFEFSFTQNWVLACDFTQVYAAKTTFSGRPGLTALGTVAKNTFGSSDQTSLAPAIEYNFSEDLGIITGFWFTLSGRNSTDFLKYVFSIAYNF